MNPKNYNQNSLQRQGSAVNGKLNFENNAQFNGYRDDLDKVYDQAPLRPNYTRQELNNADIPTKIGREIRAEKYRIFFIGLISFLMIAVGTFFIACYWGAPVAHNGQGQETKWLIPKSSVPQPGFMIALLALGIAIFTLTIIQYLHLLTNIKSYKADILSGQNTIPYFLIKSYKSLIARVVYANWIAITSYILLGIYVGILWALKASMSKFHNSFNTELIIGYVLLGVVFVIHMFTLLSARYRKGNLNSYFNVQIVSDEQAHEISHHANKICLVTFIVVMGVVLFAISIPYLIVRKKKQKPLLP